MTLPRITQLRDFLAGDGTPRIPRPWIAMESAELKDLLAIAEHSMRMQFAQPQGRNEARLGAGGMVNRRP